MSDPRLTAEEVELLISRSTSTTFWAAHETLRADVARLTAENARLKRTLANDPHEAGKKLVNLAKSFRTCDRCEQEIAENDETSPVILCGTCDGQFATLTAEHAALRDLSYECLHDFTGNTGCGFGSNTPGDCPNCHRPLTPQTWRDRAMSAAAKIPHLNDALRADVERLTAENAALKTSDSQRVILEMLLSAIDTVLLGNEVSDFEESFPPVRQVIDLKDERDHLRAERDTLDAYSRSLLADIQRLTFNAQQLDSMLDASRQEGRHEITALRQELAEARAEIARLHELLAEAGWTKEPR
jgi:hypothetical protein